MLIRRLLASAVQSQKRRILLSPTGSLVNNNEPSTLKQKILHQMLQLLLFGQRSHNVSLANTSLNRALKYTGLGMSLPKQIPKNCGSEEPGEEVGEEEEEKKKESSPSMRNDPTQSHSIDSLDEPGVLDELQTNYKEARKQATSCWLNYANKSCYIYLYRGGGEPSQTIAAFDLDGTIIRPKSNKRIPRSSTDWDFFSVWTKVKLQQCLRERRARFVIFTNQNGIGLNIVPLDEVQQRIELVTRRIDVPCIVFMATQKDQFRKPQTGMFQLLDKSFNDSLRLDHENSLYCGDAIGYPSHSDADIKFAQKLGLPFITPEKFVRGVKPKFVS